MDKSTPKITEWGQIRLVCPCGGVPELKYDFNIVNFKRQTFYQCVNPECPNIFSTDYHLKIMQWLNKYYEENETFDGFVHYFTSQNCNMRAKYIKTITVIEGIEVYVIEITNTTKQKSVSH